MKTYNKFINNINEMDMAFSDVNIFNINPYDENNNLNKISFDELGENGQLVKYKNDEVIKFGMLKALYHDAVEYKKKREYTKGLAKFALRFIPLAIAPIFFPIWLISQILGTTRAINKILIPSLLMDHKNYNSFLKTLISKTMLIAEGDIKPLLGKDWYYDIFKVHDGLISMVRKEHIYEFSIYIAEEIQKKPDNLIVPEYWLDNEFRKWLNNKFNTDLPIGKVMTRHMIKK